MHARTHLLGLALCIGLGASAQTGLLQGEYFWDTDPGTGNGSALVAVDGTFGQALEQVMVATGSLPAPGTHRLYLRVQDDDGAWGPAFGTVVDVLPGSLLLPDITVSEGEYFWDTDPGEGNGAPLLAFDGNFDAALEAVRLETATLPAPGTHTLGLRVMDVNGNWSGVFRVVVDVLPGTVTFPAIHVNAAEYWVDTDPGEGNATPMLAADGNFGSAVEAIRGGAIPVPVFAGNQVLWMRAQDDDGDWGPPFGIVVNIDTTIAGTVSVPQADAAPAVQIGPNPTTAAQGITIQLSAASGARVRILDIRGRVLLDHPLSSTDPVHLSLEGYAAGTYPVGIIQGDRQWWSPVVVR
ncbi:MAG: hypothetical protein H6594_11120 [Flavobacteriales bacterium]|nr:hypothetical protein [Flavobacteriales bacterium]